MRTIINAAFTYRNVFGLNQDRVVLLCREVVAHAVQHLASWHASKRARGLDGASKRRGSAARAGAVPAARLMCLAIRGSQWQPVRLTSPVLVTA
jgi:hypothetical protein